MPSDIEIAQAAKLKRISKLSRYRIPALDLVTQARDLSHHLLRLISVVPEAGRSRT